MDEFVKVRKDEWEQHRKDVETFIQRYKESLEKVKELAKDNAELKEKLQLAEDKLEKTDQRTVTDIQQTSEVIQKIRSDITQVLQQTEKEMDK